jgi:glycosyltransferase involved in cell wall biosynthesis
MSRVVMYVFNDATNDSRVLREAEALAHAGHEVTVMARARDLETTAEEVEQRDGFTIVRVPVAGAWWAWWRAARRPRYAPALIGRTLVSEARRFPIGWLRALIIIVSLAGLTVYGLVRRTIRIVREAFSGRRQRRLGNVAYMRRWLLLLGDWARAAAERAPGADVHHGHDLTGLSAATRGAARDGTKLVYDSHEIFLESADHALRWGAVRRMLGGLERRWARGASALVTVNEAVADELAKRVQAPRIVVLHNCPSRWQPPVPRPDLLRDRLGIPAHTPIALYHGAFALHRGLENIAAATLDPALDGVHTVFLGYGTLHIELLALEADPRYGGRLHVLDAVAPEDLLSWIASADVGIMVSLRTTLNHWLATPNKLFECLAAGVPVVASDFPLLRRIVMEDPRGPLGVVCDPTDVRAIARSIASVVRADPATAEALRQRCLGAAHDRWNWETEVVGLLDLYRDLAAA